MYFLSLSHHFKVDLCFLSTNIRLFSPHNSPFTLMWYIHVHALYNHRQELHKWITIVLIEYTLDTVTNTYLSDNTRTSMLIEPTIIALMVERADHTVTTDMYHFLTYTEWIAPINHISTTLLASPLTLAPTLYKTHTPTPISTLLCHTITNCTYIA